VIEALAGQALQSISEFVQSAVFAYVSGETMSPSSMFDPGLPASYGSPCARRSARRRYVERPGSIKTVSILD